MCEQLLCFKYFKVLTSSNSEFHLKFKESVLILHDQAILNKMKHLRYYICFISYTNILQYHLTIYLFSSLIHCYLLFAVFSFKIVFKVF